MLPKQFIILVGGLLASTAITNATPVAATTNVPSPPGLNGTLPYPITNATNTTSNPSPDRVPMIPGQARRWQVRSAAGNSTQSANSTTTATPGKKKKSKSKGKSKPKSKPKGRKHRGGGGSAQKRDEPQFGIAAAVVSPVSRPTVDTFTIPRYD